MEDIIKKCVEKAQAEIQARQAQNQAEGHQFAGAMEGVKFLASLLASALNPEVPSAEAPAAPAAAPTSETPAP